MVQTIHAEKRSKLSRSGLRQLRQSGRIPSVVYGKHVDDMVIHISAKDFNQWAKQGVSGVVELNIADSEKLPVMLEEVQYDPVTRDLLHADFVHVRMDEVVRSRIPIEFIGSAAGVSEGGLLHIESTHLEVECLPKDLPTSLEVDVSSLAIGDSIHANEISLPNDVTLASEPEEVIVSVLAPRPTSEEVDEDTETVAEETEAAEEE